RERFDPLYRSFIDDFKGTGTPDLDKGSELLRVVEELDEEFQEYRERYGHGGLAGERKAVYTAQLYRAKAMIERIRIGVVAMMTAESAGQVFIGEAFEGTTVEELMAYAANNSFTFTPANQLERATYEKVYREMVRYYLTLHGVARAIEQDKQRIAPLTEQEHELMDIEYENSLEDLHGIYATSRAPVAFTAFVSDVSSEWFVGDVADDFWDWYKRR
ncbi:MAG TPA: hypothetical protein P5307_24425, partial [Pirellulaceae bacterium]|nr:hypothetical protein [Pirellulaceae bacterium]